MEEREALKRQIKLLQDLISKHKSVHGDAPFAGPELRHPQAPSAAGASVAYPHSSRGRPYPPQSRGSWRKTYSLRNTGPQSTGGQSSVSAPSSLHQSAAQLRTDDVSLPGHSRRNEANQTKTAAVLSVNSYQHKEEHSKTRLKGAATNQLNTDAKKQGLSPASISAPHKASQTPVFQQNVVSRLVLPEKKTGDFLTAPPSMNTNSALRTQNRTEILNKPSLMIKTRTDIKKTSTSTTSTAGKSTPALTASSGVSKHYSQNVSSLSISTEFHDYVLKKSKFTWVKSQTVDLESRAASSVSSSMSRALFSSASASKAVVSTEKPFPASLSKRTPPRKLARKLSPVAVAPKTSKYKWVSSSGLQTRTPRKLSPKALVLPQRILERGDSVKKTKAASAQSVKVKKEAAVSPSSSSSVSRYRWRAGGQGASVSAGAAVSHRMSTFHWTAERNKGAKAGFVVSPTLTQRSHLLSSSPRGFKLRSRMKIIRRAPGSGSEKGGNLSLVKLSPRARLHASIRSPAGVRRTPSRELVSFGRHKLRRLSPTSLKTTAEKSQKINNSQRVPHSKLEPRPSSS